MTRRERYLKSAERALAEAITDNPATPPAEARHTPGPWRIGDAGHTVFGPPRGLPPKIIASNLSTANAARIVACVNALEGWHDPAAVGDLLEAAELAEGALDGLTDDGHGNRNAWAALDALRAAIAWARRGNTPKKAAKITSPLGRHGSTS
jgi:hypothetical protein